MPPIDPAFRPADYWDPTNPTALILANIKGAQRRAGVRTRLAARDEEVPDHLLADSLTGTVLDEWVRQGPGWIGGELLPEYLAGELEICRVVIHTERLDVISLRARRRNGRIHYRMVDEQGGTYRLSRATSVYQLTAQELCEQVDCATVMMGTEQRPLLHSIWNRLREGRSGWMTYVESPFYPGLETHYHEREAEYLGLPWQAREAPAPFYSLVAPEEEQDAIDELAAALCEKREPDEAQLALVTKWFRGGTHDVSMDQDLTRIGCRLVEEVLCFSDDDVCDTIDEDDDYPVDDAMRVAFLRGHLYSIMDGNHDADINPAFGPVFLLSRAGQAMVLGASVAGYSFSSLTIETYGLFPDAAAFFRFIREEGWITTREEVDALDDTDILAMWEK